MDPNARGRLNKGIKIQERSSLIQVEAIGCTWEGKQSEADKKKQGADKNPRSQRYQTARLNRHKSNETQGIQSS